MHIRRATLAIVVSAAMALSIAGCSSGGNGGSAGTDPKAPVTVWVDAARQPQAVAYAKAHPNVKIKVDVISGAQGASTQKISLAKKAGTALPDVVFIGSPDEIANLAANPLNYPLALNNVVPKKVIDNFPKGVLDRCTYGGQIYCLGNDIGQTVLFYNKPLFQEWGYQVPKTFAEFKALGARLAAEHPGYNLGTVSGRYGVDAFFASSGCPVLDATSATAVKINTADSKCSRVGDLIGPMMKNGSLSTLDLFDKGYDKQIADGKVVAMIGASWIGDFAFKPMTTDSGSAFDAAGKYAVAPMPTWADGENNWSGTVGGGIWVVSKTTKNQKAAVAFAQAMTTSPTIAKTQTTYPAYGPSANIWLQAKAEDSWYAENPASVMKAAAANINPTEGYTRYVTQMLDSFNNTVIKNGASDMSQALKQWGQETTQAAQAAGYKVSK